MAGYGLAAFIFNFVAKAVVNPDNMKPDVKVEEDGVTIKYYNEEVANNIPKLFQILAACWLVMGITGVYIINVPKEMMNKKHIEKNTEAHEMHELHEQHKQHNDVNQNGNNRPGTYHSVKEILSPAEPQTEGIFLSDTNRENNKESPPSNRQENPANKKILVKKSLESSAVIMTHIEDNHDANNNFHNDHHDLHKTNHNNDPDHDSTKIRIYKKNSIIKYYYFFKLKSKFLKTMEKMKTMETRAVIARVLNKAFFPFLSFLCL